MTVLFWIAVIAVVAILTMITILFHNWEVDNRPWNIGDYVGIVVMTLIYVPCSIAIVSLLSGVMV